MVNRRSVLRSITGGVGCVTLSGCLSRSAERTRSTPTENASSGTSSSTESPTAPATETTRAPERTLPATSELPALRLANHTASEHTLTLEVAPEHGDFVTDSWPLPANSHIEIDTYEPLALAATITVSVEGFETMTDDWPGHEPGQTLGVTVAADAIEIETFIA